MSGRRGTRVRAARRVRGRRGRLVEAGNDPGQVRDGYGVTSSGLPFAAVRG